MTLDTTNTGGALDTGYTASRGATSFYLPDLSKYDNANGYTQHSCISVQDATGAANAASITYYWGASGGGLVENWPIPANGSLTTCQQDRPLPHGALSAKVTSTGPVAVSVSQANDVLGQAAGYGGATSGATTVILPFLAKGAGATGQDWQSTLVVQNTGAQSATPYATLYNADGSVAWSGSLGATLGPGHALQARLADLAGLPDLFRGSASVTAGQPVAVVVSARCASGCSGDTSYAYNGVNR